MILVFPFCSQDFAQALKWMEHAETLHCRGHSIILMPAKGLPGIEQIQQLALAAFGNVSVLPDAEGITGHPEGPNSMMRQAVWHMQMNNLGPWTFMEPDCILLEPDALDIWEREYRSFQKPFMGEFRPANPPAPDYLSGNMVLPANALLEAPMLARRGLSRDGVELAFDIVAASQTLPKAHLTKLLHQVPKREDGGGTHFPDQESLKLIRPGAVMFHPCKDGSLIDRLRERRGRDGQQNHILADDGSTPSPGSSPRLISPREARLAAENNELRERLSTLEARLDAASRNLESHDAGPKTLFEKATGRGIGVCREPTKKKKPMSEATKSKLRASWQKRKLATKA